MNITSTPAWQALQRHRESLSSFRLDDALRADPARARSWRFEAAGIEADLSRNLATDETWKLLLALDETAELPRWRDRLFAGQPINDTEGRPAWHTALRTLPADAGVASVVERERSRMLEFAEQLRGGQVRGSSGRSFETVICIGI